jgi:hypothetical protein
MVRRAGALLAAVAGAGLVASCDDPREPELRNGPPANLDRGEGRAIGGEAERSGEGAERAGERSSPGGERK